MKSLVDDILAREVSPDFEFAWTPTETIDPEAQERMLTSYTGRGILTLNEARAVLGRAPLADALADTPMTLTAVGYVGLGTVANSTAKCAERLGGMSKEGNWDESKHPRKPAGASQGGQFTTNGETSSASRQQTARSDSRTGHQVADVVPICMRGTYVKTRIDGIMHYRAEYDCFDGRVIERYSIGEPLDPIIRQR